MYGLNYINSVIVQSVIVQFKWFRFK